MPNSKPKRSIPAILSLIVLLLALAGYFTLVPSFEAERYTKIVTAKQPVVSNSMSEVFASFQRDVFTKTDTKPEADSVDVNASISAVGKAKSAVDTNWAGLTNFHRYPFLNWNKKFSQAKELSKRENNLLAKQRQFLSDYSEMLSYTRKLTDVNIRMNSALDDFNNTPGDAPSAEMALALENLRGKLLPLENEEKALEPPAFMKPQTDEKLAEFDTFLSTLGDLVSATRSGNTAKINSLDAQMKAQTSKINASKVAFMTFLQTDSPINRSITELRKLNEALAPSLSAL